MGTQAEYSVSSMRESCTPDQVQRRLSHIAGELENRVTSIPSQINKSLHLQMS